MKKKIIALLLLGVMVFSFAACSQEQSTEDKLVGKWRSQSYYLDHYGFDVTAELELNADGSYSDMLYETANPSNVLSEYHGEDWEYDEEKKELHCYKNIIYYRDCFSVYRYTEKKS